MEHRNTMLGEDITSGFLDTSKNISSYSLKQEATAIYGVVVHSDDNFKGMAKKFGKSVSESSLGQLIGMTAYKGRIASRSVVPINSRFTTMTCSTCGLKTGPKGWTGLKVRSWKCSGCSSDHDRDINAAMVVFKTGAGIALEREVRI